MSAKRQQKKLDKWYADHAGVVSLATLIELGFSQSSVRRMVMSKTLITLQAGVYQSSQYPTGDLQRQIAVCMRNPSVAIAFISAAQLWGFRNLPKNRLIHVLVPHGCSPQLRGVIVHRCRQIDPEDLVERTDGIRLTSPPRTLFDIADAVGDIAATSILEQIINAGSGLLVTHIRTFARLGKSRRPGTATMGRVLQSRRKWSRAMQSALETTVLDEIRRQDLPVPETQHGITLPNGDRIRFDFAWPSHFAGLEVDHPFWHAGEEPSHTDKWHDRKAATIGWSTTRITNFDVDGGLREAIEDVAEILAVTDARLRLSS